MKDFKKSAAILAALTMSTATAFAFGCANNDGKTEVTGNNKNDSANVEIIPTEYEIDKLITETEYEMESPVYLRTSSGMGMGIDLVKTAYLDLTELKTGAYIFEKSFIDGQVEKATVNAINSSSGKIFDASDLNGVAEGLADTFDINVSSEVKKVISLTNTNKIMGGSNSCVNNYYFVLTKTFNGYSLSLPDLSDDLSVYKANLSSHFIENVGRVINGAMSYEQFFGTYGTHVIMEGNFGGKINLCYGAHSDSYDVGGQYKSAITAELKRTISTGADKNVITNIAQSVLNCTIDDISESTRCIVNGGVPFTLVGIRSFMDSYDKWLPSLGKDNVLISFTENGAVPVWKLLPEEYENHSAEFEKALNDYAVKYVA